MYYWRVEVARAKTDGEEADADGDAMEMVGNPSPYSCGWWRRGGRLA